MAFFLGISITLNIICLIIFFFQYKYSLKGVKRKIENYALENLMEQDTPKNIENLNDLNSKELAKNLESSLEKFIGGLNDYK